MIIVFLTQIYLFSNNNIKSNPFIEIKGEAFFQSLFNSSNKSNENNNTNNKKGLLFDYNEEEDERDKPKTVYSSEHLKGQDYSYYTKLYNTHLYNLFLYRKSGKKCISKKSGFFPLKKLKMKKVNNIKLLLFLGIKQGINWYKVFLTKI